MYPHRLFFCHLQLISPTGNSKCSWLGEAGQCSQSLSGGHELCCLLGPAPYEKLRSLQMFCASVVRAPAPLSGQPPDIRVALP